MFFVEKLIELIKEKKSVVCNILSLFLRQYQSF